MSLILIGPSFHPQGAETSCATCSGTRNLICMPLANSVRSEDTTKITKDTWSEEKGCTQRLQEATPCILRGTLMPVLLFCMGTNHRALHKQIELTVTQRQGTALCSNWDLLGAPEPDLKWGTLWERCRDKALQARLVALFETVFSLPSNQLFPGRVRLPLQDLQGQACQHQAEYKVPRERSDFFFPLRKWALLISKEYISLPIKKKISKCCFRLTNPAESLLTFSVCPGHSGHFCLGFRVFPGWGPFSAKMGTILGK